MERSYQSLMSSLADNNTGRIGPAEIRAIVDSVRDSALVETFGFTSPSVFPLSTWASTAVGGAYGGSTVPAAPAVPAWFPLRAAILSVTPNKRFSRVGGLFGVTSDRMGYVYKTPAADPASLISGTVSRMVNIAVGLNGSVNCSAGSNASCALVFYRTSSTGTWPTSGTTRELVFPFDTGVGPGFTTWAMTIGGVDNIILDPGDSLRYRLEYYGNSIDHGVSTPSAITSISISQFTMHMSTLGIIEPPADCELNVSIPANDTTGYTDVVWRADGLAQAARNI